MAGNQRIESVINKSSLEGELKWLIETLEKTHSLITSTPQITSAYKNSDGTKDLKKNTDELIASNQKLIETEKQLEAASQRISALEKKMAEDRQNNAKNRKQMTDEEKRAYVEGSLAQQAYNKQIKSEIELQNAAANSIDQARAKIKNLTIERNKLDLTTEEGRKKAEAFNREIDKQNDFITENVAGLERRKINIGNYVGAAQILQKELQNIRQKLDDFTNSGKGNSEEAEKLRKEQELLTQVLNKQAQGFSSLSMEIRANEKALGTMFQQGMQDTEAFKQLQAQTANAKRELAEFQEQQKLLSSQTPAISAAMLAAKGLAGAYAVGAGAAALFGDESGKVQEKLQKLVAIMTVLQGLQEAHELLEKKGTIAKIASNVATAAQVAWQKIMQATMFQSVAATAALRIALIGLTGGLLLLVPLIAFGASKLSDLSKSSKDASAAQKTMLEVQRAAADSYGKEKSELDLLISSIKTEGISRNEKFKILKELQEKYPGYFDNIKTEKDLNDKLADAYKRASEGILLKANAQAAQDLLAKNQTEKLKAQLDLQEKMGNLHKLELQRKEQLGYDDKDYIKSQQNTRKILADEFNKTMAEINEKNDLLINTINDSNKEIEKLGGKVSNKADAPKKSTLSDQYKLEDEARKASFQTRMQQIQDEMNASQHLADDDKVNFTIRMAAAQHYYDLKEKMIAEQKKFELQDIDSKEKEDIKVAESEKKGQAVINKIHENAAAQRGLIEAKSKSDSIANQADRFTKEKDMFIKHTDDMNKKREEKEKEAADHQKSLHEIELQNVSNWYEGELLKLDQAYAKKKTHTEKEEKAYQRAKLVLQEEFQIKSLEADIAFTKDTIALSEARAKATRKQEDIDAVVKAKAQLASLETKFAATVAQFKIDQNKKTDDDDKSLFDKKMARLEKYAAYAKQVEDIIGGFVQNSVEKQKNALQDKQDLLEKNYEKEVENINNSSLADQEKANKLKILESQKAAQTEQIERRKRQLDLERARFDKASNIANIIAETSLAVVRALGDKALPGPARIVEAVVVGSLGAAQLVKAIATPLPRFAKGTDSAPEGLALTDEHGPEMYIEPSGKTYMGNDQPTLRWLEAGTKIIPAEEVNRMLLQNMMRNTVQMLMPENGTSKKIDELRKENRELLIWHAQQIKDAFKNSRSNITINVSDFKNSDYIRKTVRE